MHAHVSYLREGSPICLFMLTVERDIFFALSEARRKIVQVITNYFVSKQIFLKDSNFQAFEKSGNIKKMEDLLQEKEDKIKACTIGIPEIKHYVYKSKSTAQFLTSHDSKYDNGTEARIRLNKIHYLLKSRLHHQTRAYKLLYYGGSSENVIAWVSKKAGLREKGITNRDYCLKKWD